MWTLLELVSEFAKRQALGTVSAVAASTDTTITQIHGLLNEGNIELADRFDWAALRRAVTFALDYSNNEYLKIGDNDAPGCDIKYIVPDTLWDTDVDLKVHGPLTDSQWAENVTRSIWPDPGAYMIRGKGLWIGRDATGSRNYRMDVGLLFAVESGGGDLKEISDADTDVFLLPSRLLLADLKWRWKKEKGLPYAEDMESSERMVKDAIGREGNAPRLSLDRGTNTNLSLGRPIIVIPGGSWLQ